MTKASAPKKAAPQPGNVPVIAPRVEAYPTRYEENARRTALEWYSEAFAQAPDAR